MRATPSIVVVYEDKETRERAVAFCDHLVAKFWSRLGLDVSWWSFDLLSESAPSEQSASKIAEADVVVFATRSDKELPRHVCAWTERWLHRRGKREGMLVGLLTSGESGEESPSHLYLRKVAHLAGMDYLTQVPQSITDPLPESPESCCARAQQVTSVLDEILHQAAAPPHLMR